MRTAFGPTPRRSSTSAKRPTAVQPPTGATANAVTARAFSAGGSEGVTSFAVGSSPAGPTAPASIQAFKMSISTAVGRRSSSGGIAGSAAPVITRIIRLSSASPGQQRRPVFPAVKNLRERIEPQLAVGFVFARGSSCSISGGWAPRRGRNPRGVGGAAKRRQEEANDCRH